jgi:hypothetical protein
MVCATARHTGAWADHPQVVFSTAFSHINLSLSLSQWFLKSHAPGNYWSLPRVTSAPDRYLIIYDADHSCMEEYSAGWEVMPRVGFPLQKASFGQDWLSFL